MKRIFQCLVFLFLCTSAFAAAKTETHLLLSSKTAKAGDTVWAGVELKMPAGWHTYWRNPGDSGTATKVEWTLPPGLTAGELLWPAPSKLISTAGDMSFITYVYEDTVVLLAPLQLAKDLPPGPIAIKAKVSWQECQEACINGRAEIEASLQVGDANTPSPDAAQIEQARSKVPKNAAAPDAKAYWAGEPKDDVRPFVIEWNNPADSADFFPYPSKGYDVQGATKVSKRGGTIVIEKAVAKTSGEYPDKLRGILVPKGHEEQSIEVNLAIGNGPGAATQASATPQASKEPQSSGLLFKMLLFAFIGGLILNVMPCVLPVISLKVLGFVSQTKETPQRLRNLGLVYGFGVLVSFAILAVLSILIQRAGGLADWGAAFRNPQFRVIITVLITLVALNLFGLFEVTLSGRVMGKADELTSHAGYIGAFFNGVLATVLATPCTAPFLGGAIAFAFTQPPLINLILFLSAGLGLALPFVLVCFRPSLLRVLPKPGVWMEQFKTGIGFAVLATAIWLFWFTATRIGKDAVLWFGLFLVVLAFCAWLWGQFVQRSSRRRGLAIVMVLVLLGINYAYILEGKLHWRNYAAAETGEKIAWQPWTPEAVTKAREQGHPVLVDFTADSCLNCQVNKHTSLEISSTRAKLKEINAVAFLADYTDENPAIAKELARYQRSGVPMVLVYPSGESGEPIVLPTVLTPSIVLNALDQVGKAR